MLATLCLLFSLIFVIFSRSKIVGRSLAPFLVWDKLGSGPSDLKVGYNLSLGEENRKLGRGNA